MDLPSGLRRWFIVHFWADIIFAVPLLVRPRPVLELLGWTSVDTVSTRLVGAALMAIGVQSLIGRNESPEVYRAMLNLKSIWSLSAVFGLSASIAGGAPAATWVFLAVFLSFSGVWNYYRIRLKQLARATDDEAPAAVS